MSDTWGRITGKRYVTTDYHRLGNHTIPAGFEFEVSVPNWMRWPIDPHDPAWLWVALWHDWFLEAGKPKIVASWIAIHAMRDVFEWWRFALWAPPTFLTTLIITTISPPIRRAFSWLATWKEE